MIAPEFSFGSGPAKPNQAQKQTKLLAEPGGAPSRTIAPFRIGVKPRTSTALLGHHPVDFILVLGSWRLIIPHTFIGDK